LLLFVVHLLPLLLVDAVVVDDLRVLVLDLPHRLVLLILRGS
jgi:hypothetical protein